MPFHPDDSVPADPVLPGLARTQAPEWGPGVVRRVRRAADLSQRELAALLGVAQSTVARWETGHISPHVTTLQAMLDLADLRLVLVDGVGRLVEPMQDDRVRDRAQRRLPAHLDPYARDWWTPRGSYPMPHFSETWRRSRRLAIPGVGYQQRGFWRDLMRRLQGIPDDHPSRALLVAAIRRRTAETNQETSESHD